MIMRWGCDPKELASWRNWTAGEASIVRNLFINGAMDTLELAAYFGVHEASIVIALGLARDARRGK